MKFFANLKCNHTRASFNEYVNILNEGLYSIKGAEVCVFTPFSTFLQGDFNFSLGAQNFYPCQNGAFTGETGKEMLDEFGIKNVLIGHSERRELLFESDEFLRAKFKFGIQNDWVITYCIGENLEIFESAKTYEFLERQLENIDLNYKNLIIAYEPIWAIGTGKSANTQQISDVLDFISKFTHAPLLYGGSVSDKNIAEISSINSCSGVLVGTASQNANNFLNLIKNAKLK